MNNWYIVLGYKNSVWILPKWKFPHNEAVALTKHYDLFLGKVYLRVIKI